MLRWLQVRSETEGPYGLDEAITRACGQRGDPTAIEDLLRLTYTPWRHRHEAGNAGLDALIDTIGEDGFLRALGCPSIHALAEKGATPEQRFWGLQLLTNRGEEVATLLADPDRVVAHRAYHHLAKHGGAPRCVGSSTHPRSETVMWALLALQALGEQVESRWLSLAEPRVKLLGVSADAREAIVCEHAPGTCRTDPRWLLEHIHLPPTTPLEEDYWVNLMVHALETAGLRIVSKLSAGDVYQQGAGTFFTVQLKGGGSLMVSPLGPFAASSDACTKVQAIVEGVELRWIDSELGTQIFSGLCVYYFGSREPLPIHDLLFYWQD